MRSEMRFAANAVLFSVTHVRASPTSLCLSIKAIKPQREREENLAARAIMQNNNYTLSVKRHVLTKWPSVITFFTPHKTAGHFVSRHKLQPRDDGISSGLPAPLFLFHLVISTCPLIKSYQPTVASTLIRPTIISGNKRCRRFCYNSASQTTEMTIAINP